MGGSPTSLRENSLVGGEGIAGSGVGKLYLPRPTLKSTCSTVEQAHPSIGVGHECPPERSRFKPSKILGGPILYLEGRPYHEHADKTEDEKYGKTHPGFHIHGCLYGKG